MKATIEAEIYACIHIYHVFSCLYVGARAKVHPNPGHIQIKRVIYNNCKSMILP